MLLQPGLLIRGEALAAFAALLFGYNVCFPHAWLFFAGWFLVPDLSLIAFATRNPKLSTSIYNLVHNLVFPIVLGLVGWRYAHVVLLQVGFVWATHIELDRVLGYGLKFQQAFKPTHIQSAGVFRD